MRPRAALFAAVAALVAAAAVARALPGLSKSARKPRPSGVYAAPAPAAPKTPAKDAPAPSGAHAATPSPAEELSRQAAEKLNTFHFMATEGAAEPLRDAPAAPAPKPATPKR